MLILREKRLSIRLTKDEYDHLKEQTENAGMGIEPFVRALIMGVEIKPRPPDELPELLRQLSAIGNNVNQIARVANSSKYVRREDMQRLDELLGLIWEKVKNI